MLLCTAIEDAALLTLEIFKKRLVVLNANLEKLEKLCAPLDACPLVCFVFHLKYVYRSITTVACQIGFILMHFKNSQHTVFLQLLAFVYAAPRLALF
jgi:hypothetical protein